MVIGILKDCGTENRVAMLPGEAAGLKKLGVEVIAESGAGDFAFVSDKDYNAAGITSVPRKEIFSKAELILSVNPVPENDLKLCREGQVFI